MKQGDRYQISAAFKENNPRGYAKLKSFTGKIVGESSDGTHWLVQPDNSKATCKTKPRIQKHYVEREK